jgi:membrane-bound inhibitor of C-type lysozyme
MGIPGGTWVALLACLLCACGQRAHFAGPGHDAHGGRTVYRCVDGTAVIATSPARETDVIVVSVAGNADIQEVRMRPVPAASGNKATDGRLVWWTKGDSGFLASAETATASERILFRDCRVQD